MNADRRAQMVDVIAGLRDVRQRIVAIAREQEARERAAREHRDATRTDARALFDEEDRLFGRLTEIIDQETLGPEEKSLLSGLRWR